MGAAPRIIEADRAAALLPRVRAEVERSVSPGDRISVPTGRTPEPLYRAVLGEPAARALWGSLLFIQLDEYLAPPPGTATFAETLAKQLFDPLGVPPGSRGEIHSPADPAEGARMNRILEEDPLRLCLLGLGGNGHVAFNEPGDRRLGYHVADLAPETIIANFPPGTRGPMQALTIGLDQILAAERVFLWVPQPEKQELLDRVLAGTPDPQIPATALLDHPDWTVFRVCS